MPPNSTSADNDDITWVVEGKITISDNAKIDDWEYISEALISLATSIDYEWPDEEEIIEKLKWKDRTFNKYKPTKVLNVRRDTQGKSGRLSR